MKSLVVYDSAYGNTAKVAKAIGKSLQRYGKVDVLQVAEVHVADHDDLDLLVIGSPTQGGRPTKDIENWIDSLPAWLLLRAEIAVFDTRFALKEHNTGLQLLMRVIGFAAPKMAHNIRQEGGKVIAEPEGFIVREKDGPLSQGENDRAGAWATALVAAKATAS